MTPHEHTWTTTGRIDTGHQPPRLEWECGGCDERAWTADSDGPTPYDHDTAPRLFYKTTITVTVLSEAPIPEGMELADIAAEGDTGEFVLDSTATTEQVTGGQMAELLTAAGSEPGFFDLG